MDAPQCIVAGVATPSPKDHVALAAVELARGCGGSLHLVRAVRSGALESLRQWRESLQPLRAGAADDYPATHHHEVGRPADVVLHVAGEAGATLVVLGAARGEGDGHHFLGSTAQRVLRRASVPVLVVRRPVRRPLRGALLTTDLSGVSASAHERGLDAAEAIFGAPGSIRSLLVIGAPMISAPLPVEAVFAAAELEMKRFLEARAPRSARVEPVVRSGAAAAEIVAEAEAAETDLLIVGSHGGVLLGSVADSVLRHATCNVLVIPPAAPAPGPAAAALMPEPPPG